MSRPTRPRHPDLAAETLFVLARASWRIRDHFGQRHYCKKLREQHGIKVIFSKARPPEEVADAD
jgi:hypothetical protein